MKVKIISQNPQDHMRSRQQDIFKLQRNFDPALHPFEKQREYTRALNATKLERIFAKPFVGALSGHMDGVYCMAKDPKRLTQMLSGSADGEIRLWSLSQQYSSTTRDTTSHTSTPPTSHCRKTMWKKQAHKGFVRGLCFSPYNGNIVSVGDDKTIKIWRKPPMHPTAESEYAVTPSRESMEADSEDIVAVFKSKSHLSAVDHHRSKAMFATCGSSIDIWDQERSEPISSYTWGSDTINTVKFNQAEVSVLASCGTDRTVILYDVRYNSPLSKLVLRMKTNAICWNPMEPFHFTAANEDHNCYTFDMRKLTSAINVYKDHASAVLDVDYSPTGHELVTGSYDQSIRIFPTQQGHSRDIYHTKRMQHIFCVKYSMDAKYVISGSDDGNLRLWKARASDKVEETSRREQSAQEYRESLKERYAHMPQIRRIRKHRLVPTAIKSAQTKKRIMTEAQTRKKENRRKHAKNPDEEAFVAERKRAIVAVQH